MKTLHLVLKSKWYDKIASGEKTSEYRECKPYWNKRLTDFFNLPHDLKPSSHGMHCYGDKYGLIIFHRGYTAEIMAFEVFTVGITNKPNDLGLDTCWEIKLGKKIK